MREFLVEIITTVPEGTSAHPGNTLDRTRTPS